MATRTTHTTSSPKAPLRRLPARAAAWCAGLRLRWRLALALLSGAVLALSQPPLSAWPLIFPCLTLLVWLLDGAGDWRRRALVLFVFLWGYFVAGLYWVGIAFFVDAASYAVLLPFPVLGLPLLLGVVMLVPAAPLLWRWPGGMQRILLLALALAAGDYLRSFIFTGFPWNLFGYVWLGTDPVLQSTGWIGIHGLGVLTLVLAAMPAVLADPPSRRAPGGPAVWLGGIAGLFMAIAVLGQWRLWAGAEPVMTDLTLRIVQPAVPQAEKWGLLTREEHFLRSIEMSGGGQEPQLVIWSETAAPYFLANDGERRAQLSLAVPRDGWLITGAPRFERPPLDGPERRPTVWNSLHVVGEDSDILQTYDKRHLVPFGEYMPFRSLMAVFGLTNLAQGGTDFAIGSGPGVLDAPGLPPFRALICYEGIFPAAISEGARRPDWILNLTNDAWFGRSPGPYQHFGMTRVRAIEQGLPLVRAANNGISAIIDPYGRVQARLGLDEVGVLDGRLPAPLANSPPYARYGDWLSLLPLLAVILAAGAVQRWCRRRSRGRQATGTGEGRPAADR